MNVATTSLVGSSTIEEPSRSLELNVSKLTLTNFRSYKSLRLNLEPLSVVLIGPNGAGKTNLLEAVSLLAPGRGFRRAKLADLAYRDGFIESSPKNDWGVAVQLDSSSGFIDIGTGVEGGINAETKQSESFSMSERRVLRINGKKVRGTSALAEVVTIRWLTPAMDRMFTDSSSRRRRFLDHLTAGIEPSHASRVSAYERTMRQRSKLLKESSRESRWISALEETIAQLGTAIAAQRLDYISRLCDVISNLDTPNAKVRIKVSGDVEDWLEAEPALDVETRFRSALESAREKDVIVGGSSCGPHRSDLEIIHIRGMPASQCSTGEQKSLLLTIFEADARLVASLGVSPILLLDEVSAHLDESRRAEIFDTMLGFGSQIWATGTDTSFFTGLKDRAQFLNVLDGRVS